MATTIIILLNRIGVPLAQQGNAEHPEKTKSDCGQNTAHTYEKQE